MLFVKMISFEINRIEFIPEIFCRAHAFLQKSLVLRTFNVRSEKLRGVIRLKLCRGALIPKKKHTPPPNPDSGAK